MTAPAWPIAPATVALGLLDEHERAVADRLLAADPTFRAEVDRLRSTTSALRALDRLGWEPVPPPPLGEIAARAPSTRRRLARGLSGRRRAPRALALTAALVAVVLALVLVLGGDTDPGPPAPSTTLALRALPGVPGRASLTITGEDAELRGSGLPPSGAHDYYEAWLADARGRMVSMGTFQVGPDGRVDVHMAVAVDVKDYTLVDVSLEPDDGDPAHSTTSVLRARL